MAEINIAKEAGRDAGVNLETLVKTKSVRWLDQQGRQATAIRVLKSPIDYGIHALLNQHGDLGGVARALIESDPEIDREAAGRYLTETSRVYVNPQKRLVHRIQAFEIIRNPDGSERARRPRKVTDANMSGELPLKWTGVFVEKQEAIRKFVFSAKLQLQHINGLTYDFLFAMASELEKRKSLMVVGGGKQSREPLILRRGGLPQRGFLEGRTRGDEYCLVLHLSNLELKKIPETEGNEDQSETQA